jgi:hypothetical protein
MGRHTIPELDELAKPRQSDLPEQFNVLPSIGSTKDGKDRENKDILEIMRLGSVNTWIFNNRHALDEVGFCCHSMDSKKKIESSSKIYCC